MVTALIGGHVEAGRPSIPVMPMVMTSDPPALSYCRRLPPFSSRVHGSKKQVIQSGSPMHLGGIKALADPANQAPGERKRMSGTDNAPRLADKLKDVHQAPI